MNNTVTFLRGRAPSQNPKKCVLTTGDCSLQAKKCEEHRRDYQDALEDAQAMVRELAEGAHSATFSPWVMGHTS